MIKQTILRKTIAAAASLAILATAANAASFVNSASGGAGELFIGVHATGGTGSGMSVVIDAGAVSALSALSAGSTQSLGSIGTDLAATFGSTWYDRTDLLWSAVAAVYNTVPSTSTDPTSTLYGSVAGTGSYPLSTAAYTRASNGTQSPVTQRIVQNMANSSSGGSFAQAGTGASSNIAVEQNGESQNYATWMPGGSNVSTLGDSPFGGFTNPSGQQFEQAFSAGTLASGYEGALDVYRMYRTTGPAVPDPDTGNSTSGPGSYQFTLGINSSGDLTALVEPVAVPEPASFGVLTSAALFGIGVLRRKRVARA